MITDIHTHDVRRRDNAVVCGSPAQVAGWAAMWPEARFSTGIHPWDTTSLSDGLSATFLNELKRVAAMPQVVAVGECGIDLLRGGDAAFQEDMLRHHIALSETLGKPLVLHVVKGADRILALRKELSHMLTQPWIWHGFRGKPRLADLFVGSSTVSSKVYVSLGEKFNAATAMAIPLDSLLVETDESVLSVDEVIARIAHARECDPSELSGHVKDNCRMIFSGSGTASGRGLSDA